MGSPRHAGSLCAITCLVALSTSASLGQEAGPYGDLSQAGSEVTRFAPSPASGLGTAIFGPEQPAALFATEIPVLNRMVWLPHFRHGDPDDPGRHVGIGNPLEGTSWRNRPFHVGWLYGGLFGDTLVPNSLRQDDDMFGGYRVGWDFDHYWGTEARFGFAHLDLMDAQQTDLGRSGHNQFFDVSLAYYPWGDAHWRPFASVGMGARKFRFTNAAAQLVDDYNFTLPIGVGVKYYYRPWMAVRMSFVDNWSIGSQQLDTMHNLSLTAGVEVHFGGRRRSYFPYHPGGVLW